MHKDDFIKLVKDTGIGHWMLTEACDTVFEWKKWSQEIPYIKFPAHWEVKIVPPFAAAIVRFRVKHPRGGDISVYLDCYNHLGFWEDSQGNPLPYWEIYPGANGDIDRFDMLDVEGLIDGIERAMSGKGKS